MNDVEFAVRANDEFSATLESATAETDTFNDALLRLAQNEKAAQTLEDAKRKFDGMSEAEKEALIATENQRIAMEDLERQTQETADENKNAGMSFSELNQAMEVVNKTIRYAEQAYSATIGKSMAYAESIRNIKVVSGQSAEETSRFIQVLDDWQISAEDAMAATRKLTGQGLAPNMETLAKLSDEYLSITDVQKRNEFVIKNLGRAGMQWNQVLLQGGDALRKQSAEVNKNLILTDKMLQEAEQLRLAQDQLSDTTEGLSIVLGTKLTPAFAGWVEMTSRAMQGTLQTRMGWESLLIPGGALINLTQTYGDVTNELAYNLSKQTDATRDASAANEAAIPTEEDLAAAKQAVADAIQAVTDKNNNYISLLGNVQGAEETYAENYAKLEEDRAKIMENIALLRQQGYSEYGETIQGELQKVGEIDTAEANLAAERKKRQDEFILGQALQLLAVDGLTDAELDYYLKQGVALGLWTEDYMQKTSAIIARAKSVAGGFSEVKENLEHIPPITNVTLNVRTNYFEGNPNNLPPILPGAGGNTNPTTPAFAEGTEGWETVPPGYSDDTYPIKLSSGEKFSVIPAGKSIPAPVTESAIGENDNSDMLAVLRQIADNTMSEDAKTDMPDIALTPLPAPTMESFSWRDAQPKYSDTRSQQEGDFVSTVSENRAASPVTDPALIAAIMSNKIDEDRLARTIVNAMLQANR